MALIAAWNFDEASGDAIDVTGNGNDFTPTGGDASRTASGHTNGGLTFAGTGGAGPTISAPAIGESTDRTVMMWAKLDSTPGIRWLIQWHVTSIDSGAWGILLLSGDLHIQARSSSTFARATIAAPTDAGWHHIAGTYTESTSTIELFVDGVSVDTTALTGPLRTDADTLLLGSADGEPFDCDDLRIYDEALSQATIATLMDTPVTSSSAATVNATTVAAVASVPAPTISTGSVVSASTVASTATVPAPALATGSTVSATTVASVAAVPAPTVTIEEDGPQPATVTAVASVGTVTITTDSTVSVSTVAATASVGVVSVSTVTPEASSGSGGWYTLLAIRDEWSAMTREAEAERTAPAACPNDGEPMRVGPHGELYCPFDGFQP